MVQAAVAAGPNWGELFQVLALAVGTGVGVTLGMRFATRPRQRSQSEIQAAAASTPAGETAAPVWEPPAELATPSRTATAIFILFLTAVGFGLVGFFCGALSGAAVLLGLEAARFIAVGIAITLANIVTGLIAGAVAGFLVEVLGRRFQTLADEVRGVRLRTEVVALAVGAVIGLLLGLLSGFGARDTIFALASVAAASVAASLVALWAVNRPKGGTISAEPN